MTALGRLRERDKRVLLRLARTSVQDAAASKRRDGGGQGHGGPEAGPGAGPGPAARSGVGPQSDSRDESSGSPYSDKELLPTSLLEPRGVFVSLHTVRGHRLRGCIGCLDARTPLVDAVIENAYAAATRDPRFEPVLENEVDGLDIEISVLGPLEDVRDVSEIEVGVHGVGVTRGGQRGVLLPQVPVQLGWERDEFLDNVCRKAELPPDAWRHGAAIQRFEAEVFSETSLASAAGSDPDA